MSLASQKVLNRVTSLAKLSMSTAGAILICLGTTRIAQSATYVSTCSSGPFSNPFGGFQCGGVINTFIGVFGEDVDFATAGQTFTVPATDNILTDFTFFLNDFAYPSAAYPNTDNSDVVDFRAFLSKFDDTNKRLIAPILYESETRSTTFGAGTQPFTFNTGGISLTPGEKYAAFISASKDFNGIPGGTDIGYANANSYPEGELFTVRNGADFSRLFREPVIAGGGVDFAFQATFVRSCP